MSDSLHRTSRGRGSQRDRPSVLVGGGAGVGLVGRRGGGVARMGLGVGFGVGEDGPRLGGVVGVEHHPELLVGVGRVTGDRGHDDDLLLGGGEDVTQALGNAGADLAEGGLLAPAVEAAGLLVVGRLVLRLGRAAAVVVVGDQTMVPPGMSDPDLGAQVPRRYARADARGAGWAS